MAETLTEETTESIIERARAAGCPVEHFDIAPSMPAGFYHKKATEFRDGGPIWVDSLSQGFWILTTFDLVREMYRTPEIFTSDSITPQEPEQEFKLIPTNINPPRHRQYRIMLNRWFTPGAVAAKEDQMRARARKLVEGIAPSGGQDVVQAFCLKLPTEVFLDIVGLPQEDTMTFVDWVETFFRGFNGEEGMRRGDGKQPEMEAATASIMAYTQKVVDDRRANPRDPETDFFTALLAEEVDGRLLTDDELQKMGLLLVIAGLDTTRAHLGWILYHLAQNPEDRKRLLAEPEIIPKAVDESLRFHAMIFGNGRKVGQDVDDWHGVKLKKGDMVFALNTAANRDPAVFSDPDEFHIDREIKNHLGFADGPHRCLGMNLAKAEMRIAMEEWHKVIPDYELEPGAEPLERGLELSLQSLPLVWPKP
jgi:cytochrome P450